ncbi:MAG: metal-dependent hydrolase [Fuerstiella sp.]|nr:metal-dependent hydrolase [Fuerstiella sp.]
MAGYREHISVSGMMGLGYAFAAIFLFNYSAVQAAIAAILTWIAGMLPDLDSETGRPVRELSGVTAAVAPMLVFQHSASLGVASDRAMLVSLMMYGAVRYGAPYILGKLTVHRGMFHSIPALLIAAELTFLCYYSEELRVRLLMAVGVGIGFLSHLVLDEMYSVQWNGVRIRLKKSAGSALKMMGREPLPNGFTLGLLIFLTWASLNSAGVLEYLTQEPVPEVLTITNELDDAPEYRMVNEPGETRWQ